MRVFLNSDDHKEFDPVVIRTDFNDGQAWQSIKATLAATSEVGSATWIVDDPIWVDASTDEVLAAVLADNSFRHNLPIFYLADSMAMSARLHPLLAVTTATQGDFLDHRDYMQAMAFGREFRIVPHSVHSVHGNLTIASMDFEAFAAAAHRDHEGVYRCCCRSF